MTTFRESIEIQAENTMLDNVSSKFFNLLRKELRTKTREGVRGWRELSTDEIKKRIVDAATRGDTIAAANYAMFLHYVVNSEEDVGEVDEYGYATVGDIYGDGW